MNEITHKSRLQCFAVFHPCVGFRSEEAFTERQRKVGKWRKVSQEVSSSLRLFSLSEMNFVFPRGVGRFHLAEIKWQWWILAHFNFYSVSARLLIKSPSSDTNRNFPNQKSLKKSLIRGECFCVFSFVEITFLWFLLDAQKLSEISQSFRSYRHNK